MLALVPGGLDRFEPRGDFFLLLLPRLFQFLLQELCFLLLHLLRREIAELRDVEQLLALTANIFLRGLDELGHGFDVIEHALVGSLLVLGQRANARQRVENFA